MRPTPSRGPSPTVPFPLVGPGFRGLNTELSSVAGNVDGSWASALEEVVFDETGGYALRKGWTNQTATPMTGSPDVARSFEYMQDDGTRILIAQTSAKLWSSTDDGSTWTDITGSLTWTAGRKWMFANFNGKVIGAVKGEYLASYNGSGTFGTIVATAGTVPVSSGVIMSSYGRLWAMKDATSECDYSSLLDETLWDVANGGGSLDLQNSWHGGQDEVIALVSYGAWWVALGRTHILIYVDGAGSANGVDPTNLYLLDAIVGTGCIARDSVIHIEEGDVWFLSATGVQSLKRAAQDTTSSDFKKVTLWTTTLLKALILNEGDPRETVTACYSQTNQMALFLFPASGEIVMLDNRYRLEDDSARTAEWKSQTHTCVSSRLNGDILFGRTGGKIAKYNGYRDDTTATTPTVYSMVYSSPWLGDGGSTGNNLKIPKRVYFDVLGRETLTIVTRWGFDFRGLEFTNTQTNDYVQSGSEYALGEYGESEWAAGLRTRRAYTPLSGNGRVYRIYFKVTSTDVADKVAVRNLTAYARLGRMM